MRRARLPRLGLSPCRAAETGRTLSSQCRHASDHATVPPEPFQTSAISSAESTIISQDGAHTLRTRRHGNEPLPVPPIMDPIALHARDKHKLPKQRNAHTRWTRKEQDPSELTPFQRELALDPHARALATPIRACALSRARLPRQLLLSFGLFAPAVNEAGSADSARKTGASSGKPFYRLITAQMAAEPKDLIGHVSYVQAKYSTVKALGALGEKRGKTGAWVKLASQATRVKYAKMTKRAGEGGVNPAKEWQWDPNMPELVLEALKRDAVAALSAIAKQGLLKLVDDVDAEDVAAVVRLRASSDASSANGRAEYDLINLVGEADSRRLLEHMGMHDGQAAIVKDLRSVNALMALEKLRNYAEG